MTSRHLRGIALVAVALGLVGAPNAPLGAEEVRPTRNMGGTFDVTGFAGHEGVMVWVDFPPGAVEPKHTHPADVFVFVIEGNLTYEGDGVPKKSLKPGDTIHISPGQVHWVSNTSTTAAAKLAAVFVTEKGKPLTSPAK